MPKKILTSLISLAFAVGAANAASTVRLSPDGAAAPVPGTVRAASDVGASALPTRAATAGSVFSPARVASLPFIPGYGLPTIGSGGGGTGPGTTVDLSNYYTRPQVDAIVANIIAPNVDLSDYYKKSQVYSKAEIDANNYTKTQSDDRYYTKSQIDGNYYTIYQINENYHTKTQSDARYYTKAQIDATVAGIVAGADLSNYYTKGQVDVLIAGAGTQPPMIDAYTKAESDARYYTKGETYTRAVIDEKIMNAATGGAVDLSNYYTKDQVYSKGETYTRTETQNEIDQRIAGIGQVVASPMLVAANSIVGNNTGIDGVPAMNLNKNEVAAMLTGTNLVSTSGTYSMGGTYTVTGLLNVPTPPMP